MLPAHVGRWGGGLRDGVDNPRQTVQGGLAYPIHTVRGPSVRPPYPLGSDGSPAASELGRHAAYVRCRYAAKSSAVSSLGSTNL